MKNSTGLSSKPKKERWVCVAGLRAVAASGVVFLNQAQERLGCGAETGVMARLVLALERNPTPGTFLQLLGFLPAMSDLRELEFSGGRSIGLESILEVVCRSSVTRLNLADNEMEDVNGSFQAHLPFSKLTELNFSGNKLTERCARSLMMGLRACPTMQTLVLRGSPHSVIRLLSQDLKETMITCLDLSGCRMPTPIFKSLVEALPETQVTDLKIRECCWESEAGKLLGLMLIRTKLEKVDFRSNPLDIPAIQALTKGAQKSSLVELKLPDSAWGRGSAKAVAALRKLLKEKEMKLPHFVVQLSLQSSQAENFTVRAHTLSGRIAASVSCPKAILCKALPGMLLAELRANRQLPVQSHKLKLLLPHGGILEPTTTLLLEQFEAERSGDGPPAKKKSRVGGLEAPSGAELSAARGAV